MVPRPGNAGWAGTSDGVAARGFVNGARRAAVGGKAPQVRTGPKSLPADRVGRRDSSNPAGRLGRGNTALPAGRLGRGDSSNPAGRLGMDQSDEPEGQVAGREPEFFDLEITC